MSMTETKFRAPRARAEMAQEAEHWLVQADLVVVPRDLLDDLIRCAEHGTEAHPDWRAEARRVGERVMELRQERDVALKALNEERDARNLDRKKCAELAQEVRELLAEREDAARG